MLRTPFCLGVHGRIRRETSLRLWLSAGRLLQIFDLRRILQMKPHHALVRGMRMHGD